MKPHGLSTADCWPAARLGEALDALTQQIGWKLRARYVVAPANVAEMDVHEIGRWLAVAADQLGVDLTPQPVQYGIAEETLRTTMPGLLQVFGADAGSFVAAIECRGGVVSILTPLHEVRQVPIAHLVEAFCAPLEAPHRDEIEEIFAAAAIPRDAQDSVRQALLRGRLGGEMLDGWWSLRLSPTAPFRELLRNIRAGRRAAVLVGLYSVQYIAGIASTILLGRGALAGTVDTAWIVAWALLMVTLVPLRAAALWTAGALALEFEALLKRRLFAGFLLLQPDEIRHEGAGMSLARVFESQTLQHAVINGGLAAAFSTLDLVFAAVVLWQGAGGATHVAMLLCAWAVVGAGLVRLARQGRAWAGERMQITHALVERMVGHRTRLAQQQRGHWHEDEDGRVARYIATEAAQDQTAAALSALPRVWMLAAVAAIVPMVVSARQQSVTLLALSLFGALLAARALRVMIGGVLQLVIAVGSWEQLRAAFHAATRPVSLGTSDHIEHDERGSVLEARDVVFRHRERGAPTLRGATLAIAPGDRVLLQGPSGSGKSTFGAILAGLRAPEAGLLLVDGFDPQTLGSERWRRRVALSPQFHENHVFSNSVAFNLLMGRRWPATEDDFRAVRQVCHALNLDGVVRRMPNGLFQGLGETGWRLSHGERSRLFIARALLQGADVLIFDESLGALDPELHARALQCIEDRARSLVLIAHP